VALPPTSPTAPATDGAHEPVADAGGCAMVSRAGLLIGYRVTLKLLLAGVSFHSRGLRVSGGGAKAGGVWLSDWRTEPA
jgi:hypothetical protein